MIIALLLQVFASPTPNHHVKTIKFLGVGWLDHDHDITHYCITDDWTKKPVNVYSFIIQRMGSNSTFSLFFKEHPSVPTKKITLSFASHLTIKVQPAPYIHSLLVN